MSTEFLEYHPLWYHIGDADEPGFAVLYGIIAMATVWVFDNLAHRLLFSSEEELSTSEAAALVTFKGSYWHQLFGWAMQKKLPKTRPSRRATLGVLLRFLVIIADIVIIVLAIPRTIPILDKHVGSPQINFQKAGKKLLPLKVSAVLEFNPCIWDKLHFKGFTPFAATLICATSDSFGNREPANASTEGTPFLIVSHNRTTERLLLSSTLDNTEFFMTHNLFIPADEDRNASTLSLPLPQDIAEQAVNALSSDSNFSKVCTRQSSTTTFKCEPKVMEQNSRFRRQVIVSLLEQTFTRKVEATFRKRSPKGEVKDGYKAVGSVNRPNLCVIPAIILLVILVSLDLIARLVTGKENVILKLYKRIQSNGGVDMSVNPLYKKIEPQDDADEPQGTEPV